MKSPLSNNKITPVILAGGIGSRLWPLSKQDMPKQFLSLFDDKSLFEKTLEQISDNKVFTKPLVLTSDKYKGLLQDIIKNKDIQPIDIILEPEFKGTAASIVLACLKNPGRKILVLPSDHLLSKRKEIKKAILEISDLELNKKILIFGKKPVEPNTGFGYISTQKKPLNIKKEKVYKVKKFVEKPDIKLAKKLIKENNTYWNCGIFYFEADFFLQEIKNHNPEIFKYCSKAYKNQKLLEEVSDSSLFSIDKKIFKKCPDKSIDIALIEKSKNTFMLEFEGVWDDLGTWKNLWRNNKKDSKGNVMFNSSKNIFFEKSKNSFFYNVDSKPLVAYGIENLIVINNGDGLLLLDKSNSDSFKNLLSKIGEDKIHNLKKTALEKRPWGKFEVILKNESFQIKKISVKKGCKLSLQSHTKRVEHWIVLKGNARVTKDKKSFELRKNQSTFIPINCKHRLENIGKRELEIIEIQTGTYFGEDDIIRYDDDYGR